MAKQEGNKEPRGFPVVAGQSQDELRTLGQFREEYVRPLELGQITRPFEDNVVVRVNAGGNLVFSGVSLDLKLGGDLPAIPLEVSGIPSTVQKTDEVNNPFNTPLVEFGKGRRDIRGVDLSEPPVPVFLDIRASSDKLVAAGLASIGEDRYGSINLSPEAEELLRKTQLSVGVNGLTYVSEPIGANSFGDITISRYYPAAGGYGDFNSFRWANYQRHRTSPIYLPADPRALKDISLKFSMQPEKVKLPLGIYSSS